MSHKVEQHPGKGQGKPEDRPPQGDPPHGPPDGRPKGPKGERPIPNSRASGDYTVGGGG